MLNCSCISFNALNKITMAIKWYMLVRISHKASNMFTIYYFVTKGFFVSNNQVQLRKVKDIIMSLGKDEKWNFYIFIQPPPLSPLNGKFHFFFNLPYQTFLIPSTDCQGFFLTNIGRLKYLLCHTFWCPLKI